MNTTINQKSVTFTAQDMHNLFNISENMNSAEDDMAKADAIADIFTEALERGLEHGTPPAKPDVTLHVARAIFDYSRRAINTMVDANEHLNDLYSAKYPSYMGGAENE